MAGPVANGVDARRALVRAAVERVRAEPGLRLQLKPAPGGEEGLEGELPGGPWIEAYTVELPERPEELRFGNSKNHGRIRSHIKRAAREGVQIVDAPSIEDLRAWHQLYLETMRWHVVPPRSLRFFEALWEELRPSGALWMLLAVRGEGAQREILAGSLFVSHGATVHYAFNGRRTEALPLGCNDAIQWHAIHDARDRGFRFYEMGEASGREDQGVGRYKSKWGARVDTLHRFGYPSASAPTDEPHDAPSRAKEAARTVWRRLPLRVTAVVGDRVLRYL
jgi:hypothetical protein